MSEEFEKAKKKLVAIMQEMQSAEQELQACRRQEIDVLLRSSLELVSTDELYKLTNRRSSLEEEVKRLGKQYDRQSKKLANLTPSEANRHLTGKTYHVLSGHNGIRTYTDEDDNVITSQWLQRYIDLGVQMKVLEIIYEDKPERLAKAREAFSALQDFFMEAYKSEEWRRQREEFDTEWAARAERTRQLMASSMVRCIDNQKLEDRLTVGTSYLIQPYPDPDTDDPDFDMATLHFVFVRDDTGQYKGFLERRFASVECA